MKVLTINIHTNVEMETITNVDIVSMVNLKCIVVDWYWRNQKMKRFVDIPEVCIYIVIPGPLYDIPEVCIYIVIPGPLNDIPEVCIYI